MASHTPNVVESQKAPHWMKPFFAFYQLIDVSVDVLIIEIDNEVEMKCEKPSKWMKTYEWGQNKQMGIVKPRKELTNRHDVNKLF